jgi:hypothetical protein
MTTRGVLYGFGGHDSAIEASFFIDDEALTRLQPGVHLDEFSL